ncbi:MAG: polysaccharide biosynthesis/export family protein [Acidisphaera sp.]|nr:polysaccharide biosynthesis/export family protein [Acidisphaera sp.]
MKTVWIVACLAFAGCSPVNPQATPADIATLRPEPEPTLGPGDEIEIKFYYTPELNERQTIRPDGRISMPLVNDLAAAGLTVPQLHRALVRAYASQLQAPEITVLLRTQAGSRIFIAGEVTQQGAQPLTAPTTVSQAITMAQGLKNTAYRSQVLVIRTSDGHAQAHVVDLEKVLKGEAPEQDVLLQPRDIVYVPRSPIAEVDQFVDQYIRQVLPVQPNFTYQVGTGFP